jgi:hypothetical protein
MSQNCSRFLNKKIKVMIKIILPLMNIIRSAKICKSARQATRKKIGYFGDKN